MPPRENSGGGGGSGASPPSPAKPDKGKEKLEYDMVSRDDPAAPRRAALRELAMPPRENSGGGGGSGVSPPSPAKPDKGKEKLEYDMLDDDRKLKERVDLWVLMLQDSDPHVQEYALDSLRDEIRSTNCATSSVPKPLLFLHDHYEILKDCHQHMKESVIKRKLSDILSALASAVQLMISKVAVMVEESEDADAVGKVDEVAMPMGIPWADLPGDLITSVVSFLPHCRAERHAVTILNKHWRRVIQYEFPQPSALPWLLLPSSTAPVFHTSTSDGRWHMLNATDDFKQHARICGSAEGGWVVLTLVEPQRHQLFNLNSWDFLPLPTSMMIDGEVHEVTLKAAVLSGSPVPPFTVAALVALHDESVCLALWNHSSIQWEYIASVAEDITVQDLLYYKDTLYLLTSDEAVLKLVIQDQQHHLINLHVTERPEYAVDEMIYEMQRYLCESEGSLFMIIKFLNGITLEVRAYQLLVDPDDLLPHYNEEDEDKQASWVDMSESKELQGRLFFVGQASSRSFNTTLDGGIHFLDDRHAEVALHEYSRDDMGIVAFLDLMIVNFPQVGNEPLPPPTSDRDPPAWWFH